LTEVSVTGENAASLVGEGLRLESAIILLPHMEGSHASENTLNHATHKHVHHLHRCLHRQRIAKESGEIGENVTQNAVSQDNRKKYIR
jgi:hypothetical protein